MTLVLSMNPFLDPEGDPPPSTYPPIWDSERCTKTCLPNPATPCSSEEQFTEGVIPALILVLHQTLQIRTITITLSEQHLKLLSNLLTMNRNVSLVEHPGLLTGGACKSVGAEHFPELRLMFN